MASAVADPWKESGWMRGLGIPAPSGRYAVGCVDLMHHLEGDGEGGLLVRLFYPTDSPGDEAAKLQMQTRYPYAQWIPHEEYGNALAEMNPTSRSDSRGAPITGIRPSAIKVFFRRHLGMWLISNTKIPAHDGAPLCTEPVPHTAATATCVGTRETDTGSPSIDVTSTGDPLDPDVTGSRDDTVASATQGAKPEDEDVPSPSKPFPVVVFSHGLGAFRLAYSSLCCDLASHGYVVAAVEHRDRSACVCNQRVPVDGEDSQGRLYRDEWLPYRFREGGEEEFPLRNKQVRQRADDVKRALDLLCLLNDGGAVENMIDSNFDFSQFKGRIDVGRAAVMGHSFGGATTVQTLSEDPRFSCGIALDAWLVPIHRDLLDAGVRNPLVFINSSDAFQWVENVQRMMKLSQLPDENGISTCRVLTLRGTRHLNQSDILFVLPNLMLWLESQNSTQLEELFYLNMEICRSFLSRHLLADPDYLRPVPNLDGLEGHSESIIFGTNVDLSEAEGAQLHNGDTVTKS